MWVLNNDTVVEPATCGELLAVADADPRVGAVGSVLFDMAAPDRVLTWGGGSLGRWSGRTRDARGAGDRVDYLTAASVLLRGSALRQVGLFDPRYFFTWEDVDLCTRLVAGGWRLAVAERSRVLAPLGRHTSRRWPRGAWRSMPPGSWCTCAATRRCPG